MLFFKGLSAVMQENKPMLRMLTLPFGLIGLSPSPGLVIGGFFLLLVYWMFVNERFDLFGLILEDVARARRRTPMPAAAGPLDSRQAYATAYDDQKGLYADDYASAAYGGGADAYGDVGVDASAPSLVDDLAAPICPTCGKTTEWIEEYQRYYCYDDDRYV
jgi:hypothetical protein